MTHYTEQELQARLRVEVGIYDRLAEMHTKQIGAYAKACLGKGANSKLARAHAATFPVPVPVWIDSVGSADTQLAAYEHLAPMRNRDVLQFGGSGTHAVKFLLAGARSATLLSPSAGELRLAVELAKLFGVDDKMRVVQGVGEDIPAAAESFDGVYGGGCLHHSDVRRSIPEVWRVLRPGGGAAFVEPIQTAFYRLWVNRLHGTHFLASTGEQEIGDEPLTVEMVKQNAGKFRSVQVLKSGAYLRFALIALDRLGLPLPVAAARRVLIAERKVFGFFGAENSFGNVSILLGK